MNKAETEISRVKRFTFIIQSRKEHPVSPSSRKHDYILKNALYSDAGVREYWIVDPDKERITVYYYEEDAAPSLYTFDLPVKSGIFPGLKITIAELLKEI
ncbi:MAG TPA: Uma2 family endonuclease [Lachnospiraceae bacterium]|nr:Uma2 family endonuclease [Lachnospiraceae bacterium]